MSLATEETKPVWKSREGYPFDSKEEAQYSSVRVALQKVAGGFQISPQLLVKVLHHDHEVKAWLLQQLGEKPSKVLANLPADTIDKVWKAAIDYATDKVGAQEGSDFVHVRRAYDKLGLEQLIRGIGYNLTTYAQPAAQPQQEVYDTEAKAALFNSIEGSCKTDAVANLIFSNLTRRGYKLVKA